VDDADEADVARLSARAGGGRHISRRCVGKRGAVHAAPREALALGSDNSGPRSSTFAFIQASRKPCGVERISSHFLLTIVVAL